MQKETLELMEEVMVDNLIDAKRYEIGSPERKAHVSEACMVADKLTELERSEMEAVDKEKRRELDQQRNETMIEVEQLKQKTPWWRIAVEAGKVVVPALVTFGWMKRHDRIVEDAEKMEQIPRVPSNVARQAFSIPRIFGK